MNRSIDHPFNDKTILKSQQRLEIDCHNVYTKEINKIVLSSNDDKRLQTFDKIITHPYGKNAFKLCKSEMMMVRSLKLENYTDCLFYDEIILQKSEFF